MGCALLIAALLCPAAAGLVLAEDGGAREFLLATGRAAPAAEPAARAAPRPAPVLRQAASAPRPRLPAPKAAPKARATPAPRAEYASLPRPSARERPPESRAARAVSPPPFPDAVTALLHDPTLQPGDIAVFPDGPRVFKGGRPPFGRGAFEDLSRSVSVSSATRRAVLAMAVPAATRAGRPTRDTRPNPEPAPPRAAAADPRIVYPAR